MPNRPSWSPPDVVLRLAFFATGALTFFCILIGVVEACTLPVFRYALDRWHPDAFKLMVAEEDAKDPQVAKFLRNFSAASALNLEIERVKEGDSRLLRPNATDNLKDMLWTGKVTEDFLASLSRSKASAEIIRRILDGDSVVWVVVESGKAEADAAACETLGKRLRYLQQVVRIPESDPNDLSSRPGPGPALGLKFSVLRVSGAPVVPFSEKESEALFLEALAGPSSGLARSSETWVAAVFGRGRVLGAWPASSLGDEQIEEVTLFLSGACSCQVKRLNPGWDLLLHVDWQEALMLVEQNADRKKEKVPEVPPAASESTPQTVRIEPASEAVHIEPAPQLQGSEERPAVSREILFAAFLGLVVAVGFLVLSRRKK